MLSLIAADTKDAMTDWTSYGPIIGGFLALSMLFLKALAEVIKHFAAKDTERNDAEKVRASALEKLGDGCHAFQKQLQDQQDARTARTDAAIEGLQDLGTRVKIALERLEKRLDEEEQSHNHRRASK